jgi:hypothetical protein
MMTLGILVAIVAIAERRGAHRIKLNDRVVIVIAAGLALRTTGFITELIVSTIGRDNRNGRGRHSARHKQHWNNGPSVGH